MVEFSVDAPTRGYARRAWEAYRSDGEIDYRGPETDDDWGLEGLIGPELAAITDLVGALVSNDRVALEAAGAYEWMEDPYVWTHDYGRLGTVDLILPPGDPHHWAGGVERNNPSPGVTPVRVDMWTEQEGPSDLSVEAVLVHGDQGELTTRFDNLHVM